MERQLRGYLNEPYRVFYNKGLPASEVLPHYHDFRKLVILLKGNIGYMIEEQQYQLRPGSAVFVDAGLIHRPLLYPGDEYERVIVYLSDDFLRSRPGLSAGFELTRGTNIFSVNLPEMTELVEGRARGLTDNACKSSAFPGSLQESRLSEFLITAGDIVSGNTGEVQAEVTTNPTILSVIDFISGNLRGDLSVDSIAEKVHLTRSYLMHMFKAETGYTLKEFVTDKRLFVARALVEKGEPMALAAEKSGFASYSSFYRCYTDKYGVSPKGTCKALPQQKRIIE